MMLFVSRAVDAACPSLLLLLLEQCIICSGGRAAVPDIPGLTQSHAATGPGPVPRSVPYLTNETLFGLSCLPPRLLVLGGGPIGIEMAQAFQRLGAEVTLVVRGSRVLE
jgi:pyruvate/2-oxoglutarate dehydrogenase complex dihydrolipoamide dehydrogenase (E3) component